MDVWIIVPMHCIFCKSPSENSKSVEHIIPESLGNKKRILPPGIVCDSCNNYFARKIEQPLLSHISFRNLRAWYGLPNKKGNSPPLYGFLAGTDIDVGLCMQPNGNIEIKSECSKNQNALNAMTESSPAFIFPMGVDPPQREMSRFLAKMALEAVALRFSRESALVARLVSEPHYDRIRNWARRGDNFDQWPISQRRIFPEETLMRHPTTKEWVRAGFGYDLFLTRGRETYFAFCAYGYEFVINVGGPSIKGYNRWLEEHNNISPLVERVGVRIERKCVGGVGHYCLVGDFDVISGVEFDRRLGERSWMNTI